MKRIYKALKSPKKAIRFLAFFLHNFFRKRNGILIFIGMEPGGVFSLMHWGYEKCYGFEANPERFNKLKNKYAGSSRIELFNVAVAQHDGEIIFNVSDNDGASSSIGSFDKNWNGTYKSRKIKMIKSITVPCINLNRFCKEKKIEFIEDYVSDIQGMDLEVLKTIKPMIDLKQIRNITCEVTKNEKGNIYFDLPDNSEEGFNKLLSKNYKLIAQGTGVLKNNRFEKIPAKKWEMDCKWTIKNKA